MRQNSTIIKNEDGSALILAILILALLTLIGISATNTSTIGIQIAGNDKFHKMAFYNADSGINAVPKVISRAIDIEATPGDLSNHTYDAFTYQDNGTNDDGSSGHTFFRELAGYDSNDTSPDIQFVLGSYDVKVDVERIGPKYLPGEKAEFRSGPVGIFYRLGSLGMGPGNSRSQIVAIYRKVIGGPYGDTTIWEAGSVLSQTDPDGRKIFTFIDKNNNQVVDDGTGETDDPFDSSGEVVSFDTSSASAIKPYLGIKDNAAWSYLGPTQDDRVSNLIEYIRGKDTGLTGTTHVRSRTINGNVWKLGDIVHSTPTPVSRPADNYGIIYGDESYQAYYNQYRDRETVVYVGADDGMLHAFTSGKYDETSKKFNEVNATSLGTEIWAYIPQALLPHLKWLADPDYTHVYYVVKPKVVDTKIFAKNDDTHPNGWGTVLIGGLNMGGKDISVKDDFSYNGTDTTRIFSPSYFAIDVTRPRAPKLLWERHYSGLGFSSSYPAILKVGDKWFAVFGSGPTNYDGNSTEYGHIFVVDLKTGVPYKNPTNATKATGDWLFKTNENKAFMSGPVTIDKGLNYNVDAIYIGEAYEQGSNWKGALYKVTIPWVDDTGNSTYGDITNGHYVDDPIDMSNPWRCSRLFDSPAPITAPATLSVDRLDNTWIYFGTGRKSSKDQQYFFGIKDPFFNSSDTTYYHNYSSTCTLNKDDLFDADPYTVNNDGTVEKNGSANGNFTELVAEAQQKDGWFRSLNATASSPSERALNKPSVLGGTVFVPTFVPDICRFGGSSYLHAFYYETGTAYSRPVFTSTGEKISDKTELGPGLASGVGIHVKSGLRSWREK